MANRHRGDVDCVIGGERTTLRLTLGALAEIEAAFEMDGLQALGERLSGGKLKTADLIVILAAALKGGGASLTQEAVAARVGAADLPAIARAIAALFAATFGEDEPRP